MSRDRAAADAAPSLLTALPWDSDVLGRPVARADIAGRGMDDVDRLLRAARESGAALVYLFGQPADADVEARLVAAGASLVDRRTTFARPVDPNAAIPLDAIHPGLRRYDAPSPDAALVALALESGGHSRFRVDPRMPPHVFARIYGTWIARSVAGEIADVVYVVERDGALAGMVTVGMKGDRADVGLLAVAEQARGAGVGRALVRAANAWAAARHVAIEQVVTQGANAPACRLYAACGYAIDGVVPVRHLWQDAPQPSIP